VGWSARRGSSSTTCACGSMAASSRNHRPCVRTSLSTRELAAPSSSAVAGASPSPPEGGRADRMHSQQRRDEAVSGHVWYVRYTHARKGGPQARTAASVRRLRVRRLRRRVEPRHGERAADRRRGGAHGRVDEVPHGAVCLQRVRAQFRRHLPKPPASACPVLSYSASMLSARGSSTLRVGSPFRAPPTGAPQTLTWTTSRASRTHSLSTLMHRRLPTASKCAPHWLFSLQRPCEHPMRQPTKKGRWSIKKGSLYSIHARGTC
jgi:hypothetical protein